MFLSIHQDPMVQEHMGNMVIPILGFKMQWDLAILIYQVGTSTVYQAQGTEVRLLIVGKEGWCIDRRRLAVHINFMGQQQLHLLQTALAH